MQIVPKLDNEFHVNPAPSRFDSAKQEFDDMIGQRAHELSGGAVSAQDREDDRQEDFALDGEEPPAPSADQGEALAGGQCCELNAKCLDDGYRIFGSLFSMLENQVQPQVNTASDDDSAQNSGVNPGIFGNRSPYVPAANNLGCVVLDFPARVEAQAVSTRAPTGDRDTERRTTDKPEANTSSRRGAPYLVNGFVGEDPSHVDLRSESQDGGEAVKLTIRSSSNGIGPDALPVSSIPDCEQPLLQPRLPTVQVAKAIVDRMLPYTSGTLDPSQDLKHRDFTHPTFRIVLHPVELGEVAISISKRGTILEISIVAAHKDTCSTLCDDTNQLLEKLGVLSSDDGSVKLRIRAVDQLPETNKSSDMQRSSPNLKDDSTYYQEERNHSKRSQHQHYKGSLTYGRLDTDEETDRLSRNRVDVRYV
jgi:Flagellar hook-length control protein FliK